MNYAETRFGFDYGAAKVERVCSDEKRGWVVIQIYGMRGEKVQSDVHVYVTKGGKVRVFSRDGSEWKRPATKGAA